MFGVSNSDPIRIVTSQLVSLPLAEIFKKFLDIFPCFINNICLSIRLYLFPQQDSSALILQ